MSPSSAASCSRCGEPRSSSLPVPKGPTAPCAWPRPWPTNIPSGSSLYQYANPANPKAHYEGTGPEIWRDCPEVTHFVAGLGTSGTLLGVGRFLKEQQPRGRECWAVEPPAGEIVDGLRNLDDGYIPPIFIDNHGSELLDARPSCGPASRSSGPGA